MVSSFNKDGDVLELHILIMILRPWPQKGWLHDPTY